VNMFAGLTGRPRAELWDLPLCGYCRAKLFNAPPTVRDGTIVRCWMCKGLQWYEVPRMSNRVVAHPGLPGEPGRSR
jgi:hypothetical protein